MSLWARCGAGLREGRPVRRFWQYPRTEAGGRAVEQGRGEMQLDPRYGEVGAKGLHGKWMWDGKEKSSRVTPKFGM